MYSYCKSFHFVFTTSHYVFGEECAYLTAFRKSFRLNSTIYWFLSGLRLYNAHTEPERVSVRVLECVSVCVWGASAGSSILVDSAQRQTYWVKRMLKHSLAVNKLLNPNNKNLNLGWFGHHKRLNPKQRIALSLHPPADRGNLTFQAWTEPQTWFLPLLQPEWPKNEVDCMFWSWKVVLVSGASPHNLSFVLVFFF